MTDLQMIQTMLKMQSDLNVDIMQKKGLTEIGKSNLFFAIFDELGELSHELKHEWCWWKEHQADIDHDKTLEEYVDVVHFALIYHIDVLKHSKRERELLSFNIQQAKRLATINGNGAQLEKACDLFKLIIKDTYWHQSSLLYDVLQLGFLLGFSMEEIYEKYLEKNKTNHDRLESGY